MPNEVEHLVPDDDIPVEPVSVDVMTPSVIAALALLGVFGGRYARGATQMLPVQQLAAVAATSAGSAVLARYMLPYFMCPKRDSAPLIEGSLSAAYSWAVVYATMGAESAWMYAPIQFAAHISGTAISKNMSQPK